MAKSGFMKVAVGGPETTLGTAVARAARLPVSEPVFLVEKAILSEKEILTGRNTKAGYDKEAEEYTTSLPINLVATKGMRILLQSLLGQTSTPVQVGGGLCVVYDGAEDSCKIVVDGDSISALVGNLGSEVLDINFGTSGAYDLTGKTLSDIVTAIKGFTGYDSFALYGEATASVATPVAVTSAQAKGRVVPVHFTSADSGVFLRVITPLLTSAELSGFSVQVDADANRLGSGCVADSFSMSADLKAKAKATVEVLMLSVEGAQDAIVTGYTEDDMDTLKFSEAMTYIGGDRYCYIKSLNIDVANNHSSDEGYCQGQKNKAKHVKGMFGVTGGLTLTLDSSTEAERVKSFNAQKSSLMAKFSGRQIATGINSMVLFDVPAIQYTDDSKAAGDADLEQSLSWEMIDQMGYDAPFAVHMLTTEGN